MLGSGTCLWYESPKVSAHTGGWIALGKEVFYCTSQKQKINKKISTKVQKTFIMLRMEELQEMVHLIIINWFNQSGFWIWNRFRVKLKWKLWRVKLNITIINGIITKSTHDIWKHRTGFGRRGPEFEGSCWRLSVTLSWWFIWFFTMKGIEWIHISSKTWWEEFRSMDDTCISLVFNPSTSSANILLYHAESCNNWMEICCIIVDGRQSANMMRAMNWSGQCFCSSNHL